MKTYNYEDAFKKSFDYFGGDDLAANVFLGKYALKDPNGVLYETTPDDMHKRLSDEIARIEANYPNGLSSEEIFELIRDFKYIIPQGGPMSGIGNTKQVVSLSNCFVVGNESDSYGAIMLTDQEQIQLMKRRGGVGHDMSFIRPKGMPVKNSALTSTGIVPFMERFSSSTREVAQDGRRGALMLSCSIKHPDVEDFIDAKMEEGKVTGANVSVRMSDDFMRSVKDGVKEYSHVYPITSTEETAKKMVKSNPQKLWDKIIHNAWKSAEPGILFWDQIERESPADCYSDFGFRSLSTNPCGEIPLCPYDSCRLLALNLLAYVINPFTSKARFDFELFRKHAMLAQRLMDDIVDLEIEKVNAIIEKIKVDPEPDHIKMVELSVWEKIKRKSEEGRRTGIGITAEGDMLAAMGYTYGTPEATKFAVKVQKELAVNVYKGSIELADERGAFEIWSEDLEKDNPFIQRILAELDEEWVSKYKAKGRRNIASLTIAPTGSVSIMTQTTSGIEPVFLPYYKRRRKVNPNDIKEIDRESLFVDEVGDSWEEYFVFHHNFLTWYETYCKETNTEKLNITAPGFSSEKLSEILKLSPYYKATSNDIDWVEKVNMQGQMQKWVDHSISVTVNLPNDVSEELVSDVYMKAWESGCKGVTIYRDGSRSGVLVSADEKKDDGTKIIKNEAPKRPKSLECDIHHLTAKGEKWVVLIGLLEGDPYEVFAFKKNAINISNKVTKGTLEKVKSNHYNLEIADVVTIERIRQYFESDEEDALTRIISTALRHGADIKHIYDQLNKAEGTVISFAKAVARTLSKYVKRSEDEVKKLVEGKKCENCGSTNLTIQEGCNLCLDCGSSKCS